MKPEEIKGLIEASGGKVEEIIGPLPDGSGFATVSFPLPKDHWSNNREYGEPPMTFRMGEGELRSIVAEKIREAGKYAYLAAHLYEDDHDPDAFLQNLVVGLLGYWTEDGLSHC